jgi:hypothetical protein
MPENRDFKRLVRARMQKTGESYTSARAQLMSRPAPRGGGAARASSPAPGRTTPVDYAKIAGMSDAAVRKATGCTWDKWVFVLDHARAHEWSHRAIADHIHTRYKVPGWWTQMVTVGYERIKGLRDVGQRRDGTYEASKSKTVAAPASTVFKAVADARQRRKWLPDAKPTIRTKVPNKSVRLTWDDGTSVEIYLVPKGSAKTQVAIQHTKLAGKDDIARRKAYWNERLSALATLVHNT